MADMTNEERERAVLEYLAEDRRWRRFNDISLNTGVIDLDETLEELNDKGFIYCVDDKVCITHTGEDALAQTASERETGDDFSANSVEADMAHRFAVSLSQNPEDALHTIEAQAEEIQRLTRELSAANVKIESALAIEPHVFSYLDSDDEVEWKRGYHAARNEFRKRLTTDD